MSTELPFEFFVEGAPFLLDIPRVEGQSMNYADGKLNISLIMANIPSRIKNGFKDGKVSFRYYADDDCILFLVKIANLPPLELPFDPTLYSNHGIDFELRSNALQIYLVELTDWTLASIQILGVGQSFLDFVQGYGDKALQISNFTEKYNAWLQQIYSKFTTKVLWERSEPLKWFNK